MAAHHSIGLGGSLRWHDSLVITDVASWSLSEPDRADRLIARTASVDSRTQTSRDLFVYTSVKVTLF